MKIEFEADPTLSLMGEDLMWKASHSREPIHHIHEPFPLEFTGEFKVSFEEGLRLIITVKKKEER